MFSNIIYYSLTDFKGRGESGGGRREETRRRKREYLAKIIGEQDTLKSIKLSLLGD